MTTAWETLGRVPLERLADARLQLHWAAQAASAVGKQLLDHQPDSSEQSFVWRDGPRALVQGAVPGPLPFRSGLRPARPALVLLDEGDRSIREHLLDSHTLEEAYAWLEGEIRGHLGRRLERPLERSGEEIPPHPVASGARFSAADSEAFEEMGRWFFNAHHFLSAVAASNPGASPVRCWPHHFDIATRIALDPEGDAETARSINVGLSPGDAARAEPYFYATPWPHPQGKPFPELDGGGFWNTEGWTGAVLPASDLVRSPRGEEQREQAERFVATAIAACRNLLGA